MSFKVAQHTVINLTLTLIFDTNITLLNLFVKYYKMSKAILQFIFMKIN